MTRMLMVGTSWWPNSHDTCISLSMIQRNVCIYHAKRGVKVYLTALKASDEEKEDAKKHDVQLVLPKPNSYIKDKEPKVDWLLLHKSYYPQLGSITNFDLIVGHSSWELSTTTAARTIQQELFQTAKFMPFVYMIPEELPLRSGQIEEVEKAVLEDLRMASAVVSVGPRVYGHVQNKLRALTTSRPHFKYIPWPDSRFENIQPDGSSSSKMEILSIYRIRNIEGLEEFNTAAYTMGRVANFFEYDSEKPTWKLRGVPDEILRKCKDYLSQTAESGNLSIKLYPNGEVDQICDDLKQCHLLLHTKMSDPFDVIGLAACAAGVPVVISEHTGLSELLKDTCPQFAMSPTLCEYRINDDKEVVSKRWEAAIMNTLKRYPAALKQAKQLKDELHKSAMDGDIAKSRSELLDWCTSLRSDLGPAVQGDHDEGDKQADTGEGVYEAKPQQPPLSVQYDSHVKHDEGEQGDSEETSNQGSPETPEQQPGLLINDPYGSTSTSSQTPPSFQTPEGMLVNVEKGDIAAQKVDVIVNTTTTDCDLTNGVVSNAIYRAAGKSLQVEIYQKKRPTMKEGDVIVTGGGNLRCTYVFHLCILGSSWDGGAKVKPLLRKVIQTCLSKASKSGMTSIAIPALGTGGLNYPRDVVAKILYEEAITFSSKNPRSSLNEMRVVVYDMDQVTCSAFENEMMKIKRTLAGMADDVTDENEYLKHQLSGRDMIIENLQKVLKQSEKDKEALFYQIRAKKRENEEKDDALSSSIQEASCLEEKKKEMQEYVQKLEKDKDSLQNVKEGLEVGIKGATFKVRRLQQLLCTVIGVLMLVFMYNLTLSNYGNGSGNTEMSVPCYKVQGPTYIDSGSLMKAHPSVVMNVSICTHTKYDDEKCVIHILPKAKTRKLFALSLNFYLEIPEDAVDEFLELAIVHRRSFVNRPRLDDFEYIESSIIQLLPLVPNVTVPMKLGFRSNGQHSTRVFFILRSDDGFIWEELPCFQHGNLTVVHITRLGYFIVKSKPYRERLVIGKSDCTYISPVHSCLQISIPSNAVPHPLFVDVMFVEPDMQLLRSTFQSMEHNGNMPISGPLVYIEGHNGLLLEKAVKLSFPMPTADRVDEILDEWQLKIFEDTKSDNTWKDITNEVLYDIGTGCVTIQVGHFSGYSSYLVPALALPEQASAFIGMAEAIKDYVNKMVHGQYLVKLILLQNEKKTYNLAVDCVESNRHRESILYLDEYDYKKGDSMPISRDVIVKKGDAIKVTVAQDLVLKDYEFVILWFQPYQDNHRTFDVMPRKPKVKQLRGRVDFIDVTTDAIHDNLYFSILVNMDEDQCGVPCSADNSVSMLQWSGHVLTDGIPKVKKQKRNKNSRSVLILNDEWGTSKGGLSSVHRILTQTLSEAGFSVYVTALAVTEEENHDAEEKGIRLIVAKGRDTLSNPTKKDWLTESHAYHFPSLEKIPNLEIIIGHVPLTSAAALSIRRERLEGCQVFLVNHVIPQSTDIHKDSWDLGKIEAKTSDIVEQAVDADIIFSVGPRIRDTFGNEFRKRENINHKYYIPYPEDDFFQVKIEKPEKSHPCHILTFGRVSCDSNLKGFDIIAEALGKVADDIYKTSDKSLVWKIRGIPEDQQHRTVSCLNEHVKSPNLNIHPEIYGTHKQIVDDIKSSHLFVMPSRSEPFGMVAFEVMAAGLPLLVTRNSGIADYMKVHFPEYKESMIVEVGVNEKDRPGDINKWAEKITKVLMKDYEAKFTEAQIIKKRLQEKKDSDEECDFKKMVNGLI